jgi:hypothetical protein
MTIDQVARVKSWDRSNGRGQLQREGRDDIEITREQLSDNADLEVGQRIAFHESYERESGDTWSWVIRDVRAVSAIEAAVLELTSVCAAATSAEERFRLAQEVASDDDVECSRETLASAQAVRRTRVAQIGRELYDSGGSPAMAEVLEKLGPYRSSVAHDWERIGCFAA